MWILESDSDVLNHKRIWLRPGKTYLFGRTKPETGRYQTGFQINWKSVSRKHLILKVAGVDPDDVALLNKRSEITFEDAGTKLGTTIDGNKIAGGSTSTSSKADHVLKLADYKHDFRISWKPLVFSYTISSKELKSGKDPLVPIRARLAELDAKAIHNYASGKTTHVIATKRNTARGLQALIQGARIVTDEFVSALEAAATAADLAEAESFAPLETDFDASWPKETDFLPAPGKEPGPKGAEHYDPSPERKDIFNEMTFVFFDARQYETLQPPITDGGGKAILHQIEADVTTVREAHKFVKDTAGETDTGELSGDNRVVAVKFGSPKGSEDWSTQFVRDLCLVLGFRMIEQNEFLDAILTKDPQKLFRRLEYADEPSASASAPAVSATSLPAHPQSAAQSVEEAQEPVNLPSRRGMRGRIQSVFKGFDDGFDNEAIAPAPTNHREATQKQATNGHGEGGMDVDRNTNGRSTQVNGHKRPIPNSEDNAELDEMEANMFKGAALMKKRKLDTKTFDTDNASSGQSTRATSELVATDELPAKKIKKELDIGAAVRAHREAEEAKQRRGSDEEDGQEIDDMTLDQMKTLAVIEEFEPKRSSVPQPQRNGEEPRWNPDWNGRRNFKKFRRQGEGSDCRKGQSVIVPLEEVKQKDAGIGSVYWTANKPQSKVGRARQRAESSEEEDLTISRRTGSARSQPSKQSKLGRDADEDDDEEGRSSAGLQESEADDAEEAVPNTVASNLQTGEDNEVIDVDAPRTTRARGATTQPTATQQSSTLAGSKRRARAPTQSSIASSAPKRQKLLDMGTTMKRRVADDSDSDDDLKFQFRRRK